MGSVGPVSVSVCAANTHQPFPVVTHGDKTYIVASPGLEYEVVLEMPVASSHPAHRLMIVDMDVDGLNVGYGQPLYGAVHGMKPKFDYLREGKGAFKLKFASVQQSSGSSQSQQASIGAGNSDSSSVGLFELKLWSAIEAQEPPSQPPRDYLHPSRPKQHTQQLPEGKKWFTASTLRSESGSQVALPESYSKLKRVSSLGSLKLYYETAPVLLLRKVLNPSLPQHAAILASAQQPLQPQLPATQFQLQPPLLPSSSQAQDNQQGGARLKRERDAQDEGGNNVSLIDLTEKKQAKMHTEDPFLKC
uniref:Uncharacterized protein n=1 Tax=Dunaliella tertiolecta TaxID=3047 RepID=A0A7S3R912_DUNTE|mmetsp:Transcript_4647/g.12704  ORF Transcript_4647/g.12704 Transcript_4647/m.12704 type:complete len:304 (+) Transcript_4647:96-1007(+)